MTWLISFALCSAACGKPPPEPPRREAPARVLAATTLGRISLRASAYLELHLALAAAVRDESEVPAELGGAKKAYERSLADDDDDRILDRSTKALAACTDDRCAQKALDAEGFGDAYRRALPAFAERTWAERAPAAWSGIEGALASLDDSADALLARAAKELGVTWPDGPVVVPVASRVPPSRDALVPPALAARGACFLGERKKQDPWQARAMDCVLVHALLGAASSYRETLERDLGPKKGGRVYTLVVLNAVASLVGSWDKRHVSVYRRAAASSEGETLAWLAQTWPTDPSVVVGYVKAER